MKHKKMENRTTTETKVFKVNKSEFDRVDERPQVSLKTMLVGSRSLLARVQEKVRATSFILLNKLLRGLNQVDIVYL